MNAVASSPTASPLLDASVSMLRARPLRSWPASAREKLQARMVALHQDWATEWLPAHDGGVNESKMAIGDAMTPPSNEDEVRWSFAPAARRASSPSAASEAPDAQPVAFIASALFGDDNGLPRSVGASLPRIVDGIALAAWNDWLQRLGNAFGGFVLTHQNAPMSLGAEASSHAWSGALQAQWPWCGGTWTLVLPYDAITALVGPLEATAPISHDAPAPKEALDRALAGEHMTLRVLLDGAELSLGQLQDLQINDVVPLAHRLDAPAQVVGLDGSTVCHGWLGRSENHMAIELASPALPITGLMPGNSSSKERKS